MADVSVAYIRGIVLPSTHLQEIFTREALATVVAWEILHRGMDHLMPPQVAIPVEAFRALIALEWSFNGGCQLLKAHIDIAVYKRQSIFSTRFGGGYQCLHLAICLSEFQLRFPVSSQKVVKAETFVRVDPRFLTHTSSLRRAG